MSKCKIHKYKRVDIGRKNPYIVFRCVLPGCGHYVQEKFIIGREAQCWKCGSVFTIEYKESKLARPHCPDPACHKATYKGRAENLTEKQRKATDLVDEMDF